jgi:hypothetical protein
MRRIGPWVFASALTLLCAGIVSTRSENWKKPLRSDQHIALDLQGIDTIDIGSEPFGKLVIIDIPPGVFIARQGHAEPEDEREPVAVTRDGSRLRLAWKSPMVRTGATRLDITPGVTGLSGRELDIEAVASAGVLHIESADLDWVGDAQVLDIRARTWPVDPQAQCRNVPTLKFKSGKVGRLRLSIERGAVWLGDLSGVGQIELHAGPGVGLHLGRVEDLPRIKTHPFDAEPTPAPPELAPGDHCVDNFVNLVK